MTWCLRQQPAVHGIAHQVSDAVDTQLFHQPCLVRADGFVTDQQSFGNVCRAESGDQQMEHLQLTVRQLMV